MNEFSCHAHFYDSVIAFPLHLVILSMALELTWDLRTTAYGVLRTNPCCPVVVFIW
jgi:hypothetical protein